MAPKPRDGHTEICFEIGNHQFIPARNELRFNDQAQTLEPRLVALLRLLCEANGRTVSRGEIMEAVWANVAVTDLSITRAISDLRRILGDDVKGPKVIGTVRKVGYRMLVQVKTTNALAPSQGKVARTFKSTLFFTVLAAAAVTAAAFWPDPKTGPDWELLPVAVSSANETASSIAKGGNRVAYVKSRSSCDELWVWHQEDASHELIYSSSLPIGESTWAKNDQFLIYCTWQPGKLEFMKIFPKAGAVPSKFAQMPLEMFLGMTLLDDSNLLISSARNQSQFVITKINLETGQRNIFLEPKEGILGYAYPKVSPDGNHVAFCIGADLNTRILAICDREGKNLRTYEGEHQFLDLDWINNRKIGFISMVTHKPLLYSFDLQTGQEQAYDIGTHPVSIEFGENFVIDNANLDIDIVTLNKRTGIQPVTPSVLTEIDAHHSRETGKLAYISNINNRFQVFMRDKDGTTSTLPHRAARMSSPRWHPRGDQLAFVDHGRDMDRLFIYDLISETKIELFRHQSIGNISGFSSDGHKLYCRVNDQHFKGVLALSAQGGILAKYRNAWKLVDYQGTVYFNRLDDQHLWKMDPTGQPEIVMKMSHYVASTWDLFDGRLFMIDRLSHFTETDLASGSLLYSKELDFTVYSIGNLTVIDSENFCFDYPKTNHGDIYFGRLK